MADRVKPSPAYRGEVLTVESVNKLRSGLVQNVSIDGGTARLVGNQLMIQTDPQRFGSAEPSFYAKRIDCPDENNLCHVHKLSGPWSSPDEDTEDIQVYCPPGCLTASVQEYCVVMPAENMDPPWIIIDIVPWAPRTPVAGTYTEVTGTLAPYQLGGTDASCS